MVTIICTFQRNENFRLPNERASPGRGVFENTNAIIQNSLAEIPLLLLGNEISSAENQFRCNLQDESRRRVVFH